VAPLDWPLGGTIYLSTEGKLDYNGFIMLDNKHEWWQKYYADKLRERLNDPEMTFIKYNDEFLREYWQSRTIINDVLEQENKKFVLVKKFTTWEGDELIYLYKAIDKN